MILIKKHLEMLGKQVKDRVTGFTGIATTISFDLYGCVQVVVNPGMNKDKKLGECHWFDIGRLEVLSKTAVMDVPNFDYGIVAEGKKGPSEKPKMNKA